MSSRRSVRQLLVAVLLGVLVGGGLMAVTPAGAEVAQAAATSWKKIWKKELKPLADKRYYTKKQGDTKYSSKAEAAAAAAAAQAAATSASNSATDSKLGGYYKKTETDAKYQTKTQLVRGSYFVGSGAAVFGLGSYSFGVTFASAPTVHYINAGAVVPAGCSGTAAAPDAQPGHLCVFEQAAVNSSARFIARGSDGMTGQADPFGFTLEVDTSGGGATFARGTWAVRAPAAGIAANRTPSTQRGTNEVVEGGRLPGS